MILFAERLKLLRTGEKLSQAELAKALNVNQRSVSNWENGLRRPDFETLCEIANYFDVSIDYLLGRKDK